MAPGVRLPCIVGTECSFMPLLLQIDPAMVPGHIQYAHDPRGGVIKKMGMLPRPKIKMKTSVDDWSEFRSQWEQYKGENELAGTALIRELAACCSDQLWQSLSTRGEFFKIEEIILKLIKLLAVDHQNSAAHIHELEVIEAKESKTVKVSSVPSKRAAVTKNPTKRPHKTGEELGAPKQKKAKKKSYQIPEIVIKLKKETEIDFHNDENLDAPPRPLDASSLNSLGSSMDLSLNLERITLEEPSYMDNMEKMDKKLRDNGFQRSPTQPLTPAEGNSGPEGENCC